MSVYADLDTVHIPAAATNEASADWGLQIAENHRVFAEGYLAHGYRASAQSIPNATPTLLSFTSERRDNDTIHSTSVNPSRFTAQTAGYYWVWIAGEFAANSTGLRQLTLVLNGATTLPGGATNGSPPAGVECRMNGGTGYPLGVGDYVEWRVYQDSGGSLGATFEAGITWEKL